MEREAEKVISEVIFSTQHERVDPAEADDTQRWADDLAAQIMLALQEKGLIVKPHQHGPFYFDADDGSAQCMGCGETVEKP